MRAVRFRLHHCALSRSARVKWVLHEALGDDFDIELTPLYAGVQYSPAFKAINPNHNVPVLDILWDDGTTTHMLESAAMVSLIADAFPDKRLAPPAGAVTPARVDYLQMLQFGASTVDVMLWQIRAHEHLLPEAAFDQRTIDRYRAKFAREVEPQLAARLSAGGFICGADFTAADCIVGHDVLWARGYGLCGDEVFSGYVDRLAARPAFLKAFADRDDFPIAPPGGRPKRTPFNG